MAQIFILVSPDVMQTWRKDELDSVLRQIDQIVTRELAGSELAPGGEVTCSTVMLTYARGEADFQIGIRGMGILSRSPAREQLEVEIKRAVEWVFEHVPGGIVDFSAAVRIEP